MGRRTAGKGVAAKQDGTDKARFCLRVVYSTRRPVAVLIGRSAGEAACGASVQVVGALADGRDSPGRVTLDDGVRAASSSLSTLEGAADRSANGNLYALDGTTGSQVWTKNPGAPIPTTSSGTISIYSGLSAGDGLLVSPLGTASPLTSCPLTLDGVRQAARAALRSTDG